MTGQLARLVSSADTASPFMAFATDGPTRAVMVEAAENLNFEAASVFAGDTAMAVSALAEIPTPDILLIDLDGGPDPEAAIEHLAQVCDPGAHVVFVGSLNDVTLYRKLIAEGAGDYLVKPLTAAALSAALTKPDPTTTPEPAPSDDRQGLRIGVVGARGGVGATSIAISLAWLAAEERAMPTALVDLDVVFGSIALALDLEPNRGLAEAMENPARVDDLFVQRATSSFSETLGVLASETQPAPAFVSPEASTRLAEHLCRSFDAVVFDMPRSQLVGDGLVGSLDQLVIVTEPTLAGMRDAVRLKTIALEAGLAEPAVHVAVNRQGLVAKGELDLKTMAADGFLSIDAVLPFDAKSASAAMMRARPLAAVAGKSKVGKALKALSRAVLPLKETASQSGLSRLFRRSA